MSILTLKDGTEFFYKDWGTGQPVVFSHGWQLDGDAWDAQVLFLGQKIGRAPGRERVES